MTVIFFRLFNRKEVGKMISTKRKGSALDLIVPAKWDGFSIDYLFNEYWHAPKKIVHEWRMGKKVLLKGRPASVWTEHLHTGDTLQIPLLFGEDKNSIPQYMDVEVLYEDDHVIALNKPAGVETHPSHPGQSNTLVNGVAFYMLCNGESYYPFHIHRLDKDTTGAILFAKERLSAAILDRSLQERKIKRTYLALVHGIMQNKKGTINEKIGKDRHHSTRRRISPTGQQAITHYEVVKVLTDKNQTLVKCRLDTGRTHQIRVHLGFLGHPLVGDVLYGGKPEIQRQALHAYRLEFNHPITEEYIEISAPILDNAGIFPQGISLEL